MSNTSSSSSGGIGLCGMVFIVFLFLKLAEMGVVATWSWWWVTSPLWIPVVIVLGILCVALCFMLVGACIAALLGKKKCNRRGRMVSFKIGR